MAIKYTTLKGKTSGDDIYPNIDAVNNIADNTLPGSKIQDASVNGAVKLIDGSVTGAKIATQTITTAKLQDGSVTSAKIGSNAVTAVKLAVGSVTTGKIDSSAVTTPKIANQAVTNDKIADATIEGSTKLNNHSVTMERLALHRLRIEYDNDYWSFSSLYSAIEDAMVNAQLIDAFSCISGDQDTEHNSRVAVSIKPGEIVFTESGTGTTLQNDNDVRQFLNGNPLAYYLVYITGDVDYIELP